jgi:hypothetical protein
LHDSSEAPHAAAVLQVLSDSSASEVWKLQLLELLVPDWLLLPEEVVQLLGVFDK